MKIISQTIRRAIMPVIILTISFAACKKTNKPPTPLTGSYILATLDGNDQWQSIQAGGIDSTNVLGIGGEASDGSYLYIYFTDASLQSEGINKPFPPLSLDFKYILGPDDVFSSTNSGGGASVTITRFDQQNKWIEGTFSGFVIHIGAGGATQNETITLGKFGINYN